MPDFIKIEFHDLNNEQKEIIIALLTEMNYEGFEEEDDLLKAFVSSVLYNEKDLKKLKDKYNLAFSVAKVENRNWNKEWEANYHPVIITHLANNRPFVGIRASFHEPLKNVEFEIIITPKMSFGTGHHATTSMMIKMMGEWDFRGKTVLDFGTGTGILAILSEKLGASRIIAVDNDDQSITNARENFQSNNCTKIQLIKASSAKLNSHFDVILTNIAKLVVLENLRAFSEQLNTMGAVFLSGLLRDDEQEIVHSAAVNDLVLSHKIEIDDWECLKMTCRSDNV